MSLGRSRQIRAAMLALALATAACGPAATSGQPTVSTLASAATGSTAPDGAETLEQLYEAAKSEGTLVLYSVLPADNAEVILPMFSARFPGIKIEQTDLTSDDLVGRIISESRGGRVVGDVAHFNILELAQLNDQGLLAKYSPPEAEAYGNELSGDFWVGNETQIWLGAWNTDLVPADKEPDSFEDFADPFWKDQLIGEPRDWQMIPALMFGKYGGDESKALALFEEIGKNNPAFHRGHSELAELLVSGQAAGCFTCYSHHFPPRIAKGAPLKYFLTEGVGVPAGMSVLEGAPHPKAAELFIRWSSTVEGQDAFAAGDRIPTHPDVDPVSPVRTDVIYTFGPEQIGMKAADGRTYQEIWQEIYSLR